MISSTSSIDQGEQRHAGRQVGVGALVLMGHVLAGCVFLGRARHERAVSPANIEVRMLPVPTEPPPPVVTTRPDLTRVNVPAPVPPVVVLPRADAAVVEAPRATPATIVVEPVPAATRPTADKEVDWPSQLSAWITSHKAYPSLAQQRGQQGVVTLQFEVQRDGHVSQVRVVRSSGWTSLDRAAIDLLSDATVPRFTSTMPQSSIFVTLALDYFLRAR